MKLSSIFVLLSVCVLTSDAFIHVGMDPQDLDRVSEFFDTIIFNNRHRPIIQPPVPTRHALTILVIKGAYGSVKLFGVMMMLVGSNLMTSKLEPWISGDKRSTEMMVIIKNWRDFEPLRPVQQQQRQTTPEQQKIEAIYTKSASIVNDFGCHASVCWRACFKNAEQEQTKKVRWCYSSPYSHKREYYSCNSTSDCSPLWDCLDECHF